MKTRLLTSALSLLGLGLSLPAQAVEAQLDITLPVIQGAKVRRPYVAVWLEKAASHDFAGNIAVWYDMKKPNNVGATKWLPDLRSWWKASGSQASFPIDGVSGATRPAGEHVINLGASEAVKKLAAGEYEVVVEVAREHGGRELLRLPLQWPPRSAAKAEATGTSELGLVRLTSKP
ncbi:DUF2271 domain-containing protein [Uliginosibacterium sp. 31-12]|uniref:DUF2271 domain-containing protein n=1 Tax=Uliginosibacterium sp. 31-12 TaxID=3062781 RepID=UPI0026E1AA28|nr:DUF2271 domain-containing protein [Uliginosibacterium sp. 31-12]MDO6387845.1 DUF2271 domain-containing protein [Uliginosibacterium sp. 31-12]